MKFIALVLALAFAGIAQAQTIPANVTLTYTHSTVDTGGAPLTGALAITKSEFFMSTAVIPDTPVGTPTATVTGVTATMTTAFTATVGQTIHIRMRDINAGGPSALSAEVLLPVTVGVPGKPVITNFTIQINPAGP